MIAKKGKLIGCLFMLLIVCVLIVAYYPIHYSGVEKNMYLCLGLSAVLITVLISFAIMVLNVDIFETYTIITLLYVLIFILRPFQDLLNRKVTYWGTDLVGQGVKATLLFDAGYISFCLGYFWPKSKKQRILKSHSNHEGSLAPVLMWAFFWVSCVYCLMSQGLSIQYILSLGNSGERVVDEGNVALLFLSNFGISMLVAWLLILTGSYSWVTKIVITLLTVGCLVLRNARWLVLIMALAPILYYYIKRGTRPRLALIACVGFAALLMFAWMQLNRNNIRKGIEMIGWGENGLTLEILMAPIDSDLTIYKAFYGMVMNFPSEYMYMLGRTFSYVFLLFIPRAIWPAKPDNPVMDMIGNSLGAIGRSNGIAVPNIGEFYANFGIIGIILGMLLFGIISSRINNLYRNTNRNRLVLYSVWYPLMFQWVARGNFSGNFYIVVFSLIPFALLYVNRGIFGGKRL